MVPKALGALAPPTTTFLGAGKQPSALHSSVDLYSSFISSVMSLPEKALSWPLSLKKDSIIPSNSTAFFLLMALIEACYYIFILWKWKLSHNFINASLSTDYQLDEGRDHVHCIHHCPEALSKGTINICWTKMSKKIPNLTKHTGHCLCSYCLILGLKFPFSSYQTWGYFLSHTKTKGFSFWLKKKKKESNLIITIKL